MRGTRPLPILLRTLRWGALAGALGLALPGALRDAQGQGAGDQGWVPPPAETLQEIFDTH